MGRRIATLLACSMPWLAMACSIQRSGTGEDLATEIPDLPEASGGSDASPVQVDGEMGGGPMATGAGGQVFAMRSDATLTDTSASMDSRADAQSPVPTNGLLLWFSADTGIVEMGGRVATWRDRSGNGNDAVQADSGRRPGIDKQWSPGGAPAVAFDGAATFLQLPAVFDTFPAGLTLFVVGDVANGSLCPSFLHFSNGGEREDVSLHVEPNGVFMYEVADEIVESAGGDAPASRPLLLDLVHRASGQVSLFSGGVLSRSSTMMLPITVGRTIQDIGRSSYENCAILDGHVAEMVLYRRALDDVERARVDGYLIAKWAL